MNAVWWALLTAVIWGIAPLFEKLGLTSSHPNVAIFARSAGVILGALVLALWWSPWKAIGELGMRSFVLLAIGGFLASIIGQLAFYHALKLGTISQVVPISGAYPLVAAFLGWVLLREPVTALRILGVVLIVGGIFLLRK